MHATLLFVASDYRLFFQDNVSHALRNAVAFYARSVGSVARRAKLHLLRSDRRSLGKGVALAAAKVSGRIGGTNAGATIRKCSLVCSFTRIGLRDSSRVKLGAVVPTSRTGLSTRGIRDWDGRC